MVTYSTPLLAVKSVFTPASTATQAGLSLMILSVARDSSTRLLSIRKVSVKYITNFERVKNYLLFFYLMNRMNAAIPNTTIKRSAMKTKKIIRLKRSSLPLVCVRGKGVGLSVTGVIHPASGKQSWLNGH